MFSCCTLPLSLWALGAGPTECATDIVCDRMATKFTAEANMSAARNPKHGAFLNETIAALMYRSLLGYANTN